MTSFFRKVQVVSTEVPDFGYADSQRLRATSPPLTDLFGVLAAGYIPERGLRSDELVSVRRRRKLRDRRRETSSRVTLAVVASCTYSETIRPRWACRACAMGFGWGWIWNLMAELRRRSREVIFS